jgi:hypothetical protein
MRIPWRFLAAAAVALGVAFPASTTAVAATVRSGASPTAVGGLLASLPDPTAGGSFYGDSVAMSGNLAAVGNSGVNVNQNGAVYLYQRTASGWPASPTATLDDPQGLAYDGFGGGLAAFGGTTLVVGAPHGGTNDQGAVYIYTKTPTGWPTSPTVTLQDPNNSLGDLFGWSVAVSKTAIVVGSPGSIEGGTEYIYLPSNGTWPATPSVISPNFKGSGCGGYGTAVAIYQRTAVIGCPGGSSAAFIEHVSPSGYGTSVIQTLPDPAATPDDSFGGAVAISGTTVVVGGVGFNGPPNAYVFTKGTSGWPSAPTLTIPDPAGGPQDNFSMSVSVSGSFIAISDNGGFAYLYGQLDHAWLPAPEATITDPGSDPVDDLFGQGVSLSGGTLLVGAPDTSNGAGAAYLFSA